MARRYCTIVKVLKEGRITIPAEIREFAKMKEGDILDIGIEKLTKEDIKPYWSQLRHTQVKLMKEGRITIPCDIREFEDIKEDNFLEISYEKLPEENENAKCDNNINTNKNTNNDWVKTSYIMKGNEYKKDENGTLYVKKPKRN